ncbi:hypothetical protein YB2330_001600 [Saitoella coloradoensis]
MLALASLLPLIASLQLTSAAPAPLVERDAVLVDIPYPYTVLWSGLTASVSGLGYLGYKTLPTYDPQACTAYCDSTHLCVFANVYQENNNPDIPYPTKCALWADYHGEGEATNYGGQYLNGTDNLPTNITQSAAFAKPIRFPSSIPGFRRVFVDEAGATQDTSYQGYFSLQVYDTAQCAQICTAAGKDKCVFFNVFRSTVNDVPNSYTCSVYSKASGASDCTNYGQWISNTQYLNNTWSAGWAISNSTA